MHPLENAPVHIDTDAEDRDRVCGQATVNTDILGVSCEVVPVHVSGSWADILAPHGDMPPVEGVAA